MFRLFRVIIRPSNEPTRDYQIPSALWDPVALTTGGVIVLWVHVNLSTIIVYMATYVTMLQVYKTTRYLFIG